ncbi:MAG: hypothetical protein QW354_03585, partial [Desulfurococcaceae archaeon]
RKNKYCSGIDLSSPNCLMRTFLYSGDIFGFSTRYANAPPGINLGIMNEIVYMSKKTRNRVKSFLRINSSRDMYSPSLTPS